MVVDVSLLHLAGNRHAASAALEKAEKRLWYAPFVLWYSEYWDWSFQAERSWAQSR